MNFTAFKELTRIEQTLFGLPYVIAGALLPFMQPDVVFQLSWLWIIPAFMSARISGMAFNQFLDREIDRKNARTKDRPVASGRIKVGQAKAVAFSFLAFFILCCLQINTLCFLLSIASAALLVLYSYMKRISSMCHVVLGLIHFMAPLMAFVTVTAGVTIEALLLSCVSCCTIIGGDIAYALQDYEFDCAQKLKSIPVKWGRKVAIGLTQIFQYSAVIFLILLGVFANFGILYLFGCLVVTIAFFLFHMHVIQEYKNSAHKLQITFSFFICNTIVSLTTMSAILLSLFLR